MGNSLPNTSSLNRSDTLNSGDLASRKSKLASIKKRFSKKNKRFLKQFDYSKTLREFLISWSTDNLIQLVHDYETSSVIKEFYLQAEQARPTVANVSQDLERIYDSAECADVYLEFKEQKFPVHKSIVCARCPLFRELLGKIYTYGLVVPIQIDIAEITTELFSNLLRYLYSGEMRNYSSGDEKNYRNLFENLSNHVPNDLEFDLRHLLNTGIFSDVKLVFKNSSASSSNYCETESNDSKCNQNSSNNSTYNLSTSNSTKNLTYHSTSALNHSPLKSIKQSQSGSVEAKCSACSTQLEYSCHAAVLASRSRFFRNLILKYQAKNCSNMESSSKQSIRIVLDEEYIKKRYINLVLNVIYCDCTNILSLLANCVCKCKATNSLSNLSTNSDGSQETNSFNSSSAISSLFNTQTIFQTISNTISSNESSSIKPDYFIDEIIDLFVIGKFLELEILTSACENLLVEAINLDSICRLLDWSERSNGSEFVRRQCLCFLREEFSTISTSQTLLRLTESQLIELISNEFLQASEEEVLRAILKWANFESEQEMIRSTLSRKEFQDERNELIGRLIKHLRIAQILPLENALLKNALRNELRKLISTLPPYMLNDDQTLCYQIMAWINLENRSNFVKPRFFQPFYEEARTLLEERLSRCEEINFGEKLSTKKTSFSMPDNLYMVDEGLSQSMNKMGFMPLNGSNKLNTSNNQIGLDLNADRIMIKNLKEKFLINQLQIDLDYLDKETKNSIRLKSAEFYLRVLPALRTLNLEEKYQVLIYIQLKVLRDHNLPDNMLFIFEQDEPNYASREKVLLDMNLKRRSLNKNRKFSINSIDLENFLAYDSVAEDEGQTIDTFDQSDNLSSRDDSFNRSDLQNCQPCDLQTFQDQQISDQPNQLDLGHSFEYSQKNSSLPNDRIAFSAYESELSLPEKEISLDVFI